MFPKTRIAKSWFMKTGPSHENIAILHLCSRTSKAFQTGKPYPHCNSLSWLERRDEPPTSENRFLRRDELPTSEERRSGSPTSEEIKKIWEAFSEATKTACLHTTNLIHTYPRYIAKFLFRFVKRCLPTNVSNTSKEDLTLEWNLTQFSMFLYLELSLSLIFLSILFPVTEVTAMDSPGRLCR